MRHAEQQALFDSGARFRAVFDGNGVGMCICDLDHRIVNANAALLHIVGRELHDMIGLSAATVFVPTGRSADFPWDRFSDVASGRVSHYEAEAEFVRKNGTEYWAHVSTSLIRERDGTPSSMFSLIREITHRKMSEIQLRRSEERLRALIQHSSDIICVISAAGNITFISPSVSRILGFRRETLLGEPFVDLITTESSRSLELLLVDLKDRPGQTGGAEVRGRHHDGSLRELEVVCTNLVDLEDVGGYVINVRDVTDRKVIEQQLEWHAFHDPLTGLPNRIHFRDRLEHELARPPRDGRSVAVLFIDLDRFKIINDSFGHVGGDQALVSVGQQILGTLRTGETMARFGGDEFAVLIDDATSASAKDAASRILRALEGPFPVLHRLMGVEASIGIALSNHTSLDQADSLLSAADIAQYQAKARGGATAVCFEPSMRSEVERRIQLETDLQLALKRNEIEPYFQPEYNIQTGELWGLEVLMRWHRRRRRPSLPDEFLPLAEESGIIGRLGEYNFRTACRSFRSWIDAGIVPDHLYLSFNLSHRETRLRDLVETVERILGETGIPPGRIRFEMSAQVLASIDEVRANTVAKLHQLGVKLTIDKYQSGVSSMVLLHDLSVTAVKMDHTYHERVLSADPEGEISRSIVAVAGKVNVQATIVGIETGKQLDDAIALGFQCGQGFHLSPPLNAAGIVELLTSHSRSR